jgi:hypothetical protein
LKIQIENFFDYRWSHDKNWCVSADADKALIDQLPVEVRRRIYTEFLFERFLNNFKRFFTIRNQSTGNRNSFYTWSNFEF